MNRTDIIRIIVAVAAVIFATFVLVAYTEVWGIITLWWKSNVMFLVAIAVLTVMTIIANWWDLVEDEDY